MIRPATPEDIPRIVELGARHHALSLSSTPYDEEAAAGLVGRVIAADEGCCFVSEGGSVAGVLAPQMYCPDEAVVTELWWHAFDGAGAALREALEGWSRERGARRVQIAVMQAHRPEVVGRALRRGGYEPVQTLYEKELV